MPPKGGLLFLQSEMIQSQHEDELAINQASHLETFGPRNHAGIKVIMDLITMLLTQYIILAYRHLDFVTRTINFRQFNKNLNEI